MHYWPSKQVLKSSKIWSAKPPKNLTGDDAKAWYNDQRDYKRTMLDIVIKEKKVDKKDN